jgi:phosphoribosyl 1,2-cyclic phosphate phosphodiesterase
MLGCACVNCHSTDPKDQRMRASVLIEWENKKLLIDVGPEFRMQALKYGVQKIDGILFTHAHNDHIAGIDDLRAYKSAQLPCLLSKNTYTELNKRFDYIFNPHPQNSSLLPKFKLEFLKEKQGFTIFLGLKIYYTTYTQASMEVNGFRCGNLAYFTDVKNFDSSIFKTLKDVDILIINALRHTESPIHLSIEEATTFSEKVGAKKTYFTHISHEVGYEETNKELKEGIALAYDGLTVPFLAEIT